MSKWFYIIRKGMSDRIEHKQKDAILEAETWQAEQVTRICHRCNGRGQFYFSQQGLVNCPSCHNIDSRKVIWGNDHE
jgi:hypothetical protein